MGPNRGGDLPCWTLLNKDGSRLYTDNAGNNTMTVYDTSDALNPRQLQVLRLKGQGNPWDLQLDPSGKYVFMVDPRATTSVKPGQGQEVHSLAVAADGTLSEPTAPAPIPVRLGVNPIGVAVVGLAKAESPAIEAGVTAAGAPLSVVGVAIALLVLLPETLAAANAARRDRIQTSLNLAMGSAMASIGLTIPTLAVASIWISTPLELGLGATQMVLLAITVVVAVLTVVPGRATRLQASVHLTLFAAFLFLAASP